MVFKTEAVGKACIGDNVQLVTTCHAKQLLVIAWDSSGQEFRFLVPSNNKLQPISFPLAFKQIL